MANSQTVDMLGLADLEPQKQGKGVRVLGSHTATLDKWTEANENLKALVREQKQGKDQNKKLSINLNTSKMKGSE